MRYNTKKDIIMTHLYTKLTGSEIFAAFIVTYIPLGLFLYVALNLQFIDEIYTLLLLLYYINISILRKRNILKEFTYFILIALFYYLYSVLYKEIGFVAALYDLQQQMKPYIVFYCTLQLSPILTSKQRWKIRTVCLGVIILSSFLAMMPNTLLEPYGLDMRGSAEYAILILTSSLYYYYFSDRKRFHLIVFLCILTLGLLSGKSKYIGEYVVIIVVFCFLKAKITRLSFKVLVFGVLLAVCMIYVTWEKFNYYYVEGLDSEDIARPMMYKTAIDIICDNPLLGSGLATFATEASRVYYSDLYDIYGISHIWGLSREMPDFIADAYFPSFAEFGLIGMLFWGLFWRKRFQILVKNTSLDDYKIGFVILLSLFIESIADSTYLSNRGILFFMLLALISKKKDA